MKKIFSFVLCHLFTDLAFAQISPDSVAAMVGRFYQQNPQEKIYIDFDRSAYVSGDVIWFKTYLTAGYYHELSPVSGTIYVELIGPGGELVRRVRLKSNDGLGRGMLKIDRDLPTGQYLVRAYTTWMRNFSEDFFFRKELQIYNLFNPEDSLSADQNSDDQLKIRFFPEGGNLVAGLKSTVAFHAKDQNDHGRSVNGYLITNNEDTIGTFKSFWNGMGSFIMVPQKDKQYFAIIEGQTKKFPLPEVFDQGQTLSVINAPGMDLVRFELSNNDSRVDTCILFVHSNGRVVVANMLAFSNRNKIVAGIPKTVFAPGINHFTVLRSDGTPLVERILFRDSIPEFDLKAEADQSTYGTREKVEIELSSAELKTIKQKGFLSLSATKVFPANTQEADDHIYSSLLLTSDLRGRVENPAAYFDENDKDLWRKRDLLMLTHGWRRYQWEALLNDQNRNQFSPEKGFSIKGELETFTFSRPTPGSVSYVVMDSLNPRLGVAPADDQGQFSIAGLDFEGTKKVNITAKNQKGKENVRIKLDTGSSTFPALETPSGTYIRPRNYPVENLVESSRKRQEIDAAYDPMSTVVLDEIAVEADKSDNEELYEQIDNRYGPGEITVNAADLLEKRPLRHPLELVRGKMPGLIISGGGGSYTASIRTTSGGGGGYATPLILVDNVPVDPDYLNAIPAEMIAIVEIYNNARSTIFGSQGANGAISFYTKDDYTPAARNSSPNSAILELQGYQDYMEFYSPDYSEKKPEHIKPDKRATIHWEPLIETDENGKARISFYTTDDPMEIKITVEGMTQTGLLTRTTKTIKVEKEN